MVLECAYGGGVHTAEVFKTSRVWLLAPFQPPFKLSSLKTIPMGNVHLYIVIQCNRNDMVGAKQCANWHLKVGECVWAEQTDNCRSLGLDSVGEWRVYFLSSSANEWRNTLEFWYISWKLGYIYNAIHDYCQVLNWEYKNLKLYPRGNGKDKKMANLKCRNHSTSPV